MKQINQYFEEMLAKCGFRAHRRKSADRAAAVACRMALNGCRI